jgi:hypothetical protein
MWNQTGETGKMIGLNGAGLQEPFGGGGKDMRKDLHITGTHSETKRVFHNWMTFTIHVLFVQ